MRTLLVDNYDSFTFNLFHALAEVTGDEPTVIANDEAGWDVGRLADFDCVVVSPGPGTPHHDGDLGVTREIVRAGGLPILGVCLGHQALALEFGATVERAPEPWHGRVSRIVHDGVDLFEGLPSPFEAVRYHSLAVTDLPDELEAIAWTADGMVMGVRHRTKPLWGVQFHPESVRTEHGHALLANFTRLAVHNGQKTAPTPPVSPKWTVKRRLRVLAETVPTRVPDDIVFDHLFRNGRYAFWLDGNESGRSVMGDASGPLARVVTADAWDDTVTITEQDSTITVHSGLFDWLDADIRGIDTHVPDLPGGFALGWVGYLGYELKSQCGARRAHRSELPDATLVFADRAVVIDHHTGLTHLLALAEGDDADAGAWLASTAEVLRRLRNELPAVPEVASRPVRTRHDRGRYLELIKSCLGEIVDGETYEVCLTNMITADGPVDPWACYQRLRRAHPAPFGAYLSFGDTAVLSTSPERFIKVTEDGQLESKPIKGTRPRGATPEEDARIRHQLAHDEKDQAENLMIVDLVRHDLGRVARVGSVRVDKLFDVETYPSVHQMVSTVRATLRPEASAVDCVRAAFPPGSMTGAPKLRTMKIIDELEAGPRGVYSGAIGYFSLTGAADLSVVIRTLVTDGRRAGYGVGGAIVALSDPAAEYEETAVKAAPLLELFDTPFPGR
ncbi:para-aminobenzoate synthetase [Herbihabitans rhizosphaerae]|uniref:aminodeoxychorismate synthase n=1 Tax=Herbihabitans rhizosphaerae TaxID=1872711 RepID=A0A4Q7KW87_9PSEU|nr:aminodeoxychorismate synthase component I [Herbihabitans rhizosphaerae]RZS40935.1 para-aminobenzoate synthetase [Herbihabitans rhizosphaerae]